MRKHQRIPAWFNDTLIREAMILAKLVLGSKHEARQAVVQAFDKLDAMLTTQDRRGYYSVTAPTKVRWSDVQMLQKLVIESAGRIARSQEQANANRRHMSDILITEEMMMIRWIAYLIQKVRDNSFGVVVAYVKILHDSGPKSTQQASDLYGLLQRDPGIKDTTQFPRRRSDLLEKMRERFPSVRFWEDENRKLFFEGHPDSDRFQPLMFQVLRMLAPWQVTAPLIPVGFDPDLHEIDDLRSASRDPEAQNEVEIRRIYAILDQAVCSQLVPAITDGPWGVALPWFRDVASSGLHDRDREGSSNLPNCDDEDIDTIRGHFQRRRARRHQTTLGVLRAVVDDEAVVQIQLVEKSSMSFSVGDDDEWVEIQDISLGEPVLLAAVELADLPADATVLTTVLRRGQRLTVQFQAARNGQRQAVATYSETQIWRRLVLAFHRLAHQLGRKLMTREAFRNWGGDLTPKRHVLARLGRRKKPTSEVEEQLDEKKS